MNRTVEAKKGLIHWTVGVSPLGEGLTGSASRASLSTVRCEGARPLPCLKSIFLPFRLTMLTFLLDPHPTRASRSSPAPKGAGAVHGDNH